MLQASARAADYSIGYRNNTNAGIGQVVIKGGGAYTGEITKDFEIKKKPMNKLKVVTDSLTAGSNPQKACAYGYMTAARTAVYTGKPITTDVEPTVIYKVSNNEEITLKKDKDYKLQYQNNVNAGTAYVIVTGKGQYKGKVVGEFTITASNAEFEIKDIPAKTYNGSLQKKVYHMHFLQTSAIFDISQTIFTKLSTKYTDSIRSYAHSPNINSPQKCSTID